MNTTSMWSGRILRTAVPVLLATFGLASAATAQETFHACYVPEVGAVYMIKIQGLPQACLSSSHVEFSWTSASAATDSSITTIMLADGSVTEAKLAAGAVSQTKIANGAVAEANLADGAVAQAKIADGAVAEGKLADSAVSGTKIADLAVSQAKIADGAVSSLQVADSSIAAVDLAPAAVTAAALADGAVGTAAILNGTVTRAKLASASRIIQFQIGSVSNLSTTATNIGTVNLTTNDAGVVILVLTGTAVTFGGRTVAIVGLGSTALATDFAVQNMGVLDGTDTIRREFPFAPTAATFVQAGTHTFYATAYKPSVFSAQTVNLMDVRLTAVFIPN